MPNPKSKWNNQFKQLNSSKFHETLRKVFTTDPFFKNLSCYQEVQVSSLVPGYKSNMHCVDWYIEEFRLVIELHGQQHYNLVNFGNNPYEKVQKDFNNIKYRDNLKKTALKDNGYEYIEIPYKDINKISSEYLKKLIFN